MDNSGSIARFDVKPEGFSLPLTTFEDMMVEYFAYDYDGNVAICQVNITVPDDTPPFLECPQSFVIELVDEKSEYPVNFKQLRAHVNTSDAGRVAIRLGAGAQVGRELAKSPPAAAQHQCLNRRIWRTDGAMWASYAQQLYAICVGSLHGVHVADRAGA